MARLRSRWARPPAALCLVAALVLPVACSSSAGYGSPVRPQLQQLLDRQAEAVLGSDEDAYLDTVDPRAPGYRAAQRKVFGNLRKLPIAKWSYRITGIERRERDAQRVTVRAELSYRLRGYDRGSLTDEERLVLTERGGRWYVSAERAGGARQLWEQGKLTAVRGEHSLVLGVGRARDTLRGLAEDADLAVPAVDGVWPRDWPGRVVVMAPATVERMAELLSAPPANYQGIAAVTTGEAGAAEEPTAERIVINPGAYGTLSDAGRRIVMTHEATHVATRAHTTDATPLWLSEGFADWAGYQGTDRPVRRSAPALLRALDGGGLPGRLPSDADFAFDGSPERLARAYEGAWLACRMIARHWGETKLTELYLAAARGDSGGQDAVLRDVLGMGEREFTARWRSYVQRQLG
ncbi:hypothetical protein [Streptomyces gobiensis]|uniref:hypothetical protein n=1 Tax=Streptomyces gobiensis TaxID=2875706 RepID=UPI001E2B4F64|nr:hypothetical protein [Streptomyces gobiensis]UGY90922.1 hypothetical protein test1122_03745 [Streptomyces gobiensis]